MREVRCDTPGCDNAGVVREVSDQRVVRGVVARPVLFCDGCGAPLPDCRPDIERAVSAPPEVTARKTRT